MLISFGLLWCGYRSIVWHAKYLQCCFPFGNFYMTLISIQKQLSFEMCTAPKSQGQRWGIKGGDQEMAVMIVFLGHHLQFHVSFLGSQLA